MTNRGNLIAALKGDKPQRIPLTINREFVTDDPEWELLFSRGLCPIPYVSLVRETVASVEFVVQKEVWHGKPAARLVLRTPVGEISQVSVNGWIQEYFLKTPADYRVMEYVIRHTQLTLDTASFLAKEEQAGDRGITLVGAGRSPMQTILVDYAGLEHFSYHLMDEFSELAALAEALRDQLVEKCKLIAEGPGHHVSLLENLTAETWGPDRFAKYHMPVYESILPILHAGGKRVYTHYDGKLACLAELIAQTDIDGIESLTSPPESDMTYAEARSAWPDKLFWANINVSYYSLPEEELSKKVNELRKQASTDGRYLAFEISEDLPVNWRTSIPVVLNTLAEMNS